MEENTNYTFNASSFDIELDLLKEALAENKALYTELKDHFDRIKNSRSGNTLRFISDQSANLSNLKKNKLDIIKEMTNIKKIIVDLEYKYQSLKTRAEGDGDTTNLQEAIKILITNENNGQSLNIPRPKKSDLFEYNEEEVNDEDLIETLNKRAKSLLNNGEIKHIKELEEIECDQFGMPLNNNDNDNEVMIIVDENYNSFEAKLNGDNEFEILKENIIDANLIEYFYNDENELWAKNINTNECYEVVE